MSYRFHAVALPHTKTTKAYCACAYTQKVLKFCQMMRSLGHKVFHYGAEGSQADCDEHIDIITEDEQDAFFGDCDWRVKQFPVAWDPNLPYWKLANKRAAKGVKDRMQRGDFLCLIGGGAQQPIAKMVGEADVLTVEYGIGYYGTFAKYRVFESYTHQALVYGMQDKDPDAPNYDCVIPNYFDPADFPMCAKKDYLLYIGRLIKRKGLHTVLAIAEATGKRLVLAGQGVAERAADHLVTEEGITIPLNDKITYVGYADVPTRARLMGEAAVVLMPTTYMEPFGGVAVEAQLAGTPVVTSDHAAFAETVKHGVTGYRCHTLDQYVWAVLNAEALDRVEIRRIAEANYSMERVRWMYQEYFDMLYDLWGQGWTTLKPRAEMRWLEKL